MLTNYIRVTYRASIQKGKRVPQKDHNLSDLLVGKGYKMKLSEQLKQDHECGGFGLALEGYSDRAKQLEDLLLLCVKDSYSSTGKFKKKTGLAIMKYVNDPKNGIDTLNDF